LAWTAQEYSSYMGIRLARTFWLRPNGLAFSCRERAAYDYIKIALISRAKRSAGTANTARRTPRRQKLPHQSQHRLQWRCARA
jgi:hypothetical protein